MNKSSYPFPELFTLAGLSLFFSRPQIPASNIRYLTLCLIILFFATLFAIFFQERLWKGWEKVLLITSMTTVLFSFPYYFDRVNTTIPLFLAIFSLISIIGNWKIYFAASIGVIILGLYEKCVVQHGGVTTEFLSVGIVWVTFLALLYRHSIEESKWSRRLKQVTGSRDAARTILSSAVTGALSQEGGGETPGGVQGLIETLAGEILETSLYRVRTVTMAERVCLARPLSSQAIAWHLGIVSSEKDYELGSVGEITGGWDPIKIPFLLGKEYESSGEIIKNGAYPLSGKIIPEYIYSVPVYVGKIPGAVLFIERFSPGPLKGGEKEAVAMAADFISRILSLLNAFSDREKDLARYFHLRDFIRDVLDSRGIEDIFKASLTKIIAFFGTGSGLVAAKIPPNSKYRVITVEGMKGGFGGIKKGTLFEGGDTLFDWCIEKGVKRVVTRDSKDGGRAYSFPGELGEKLPKGRVLVAPFTTSIGEGEKIDGSLIIVIPKENSFSADDLDVVDDFIEVSLMAIPRASDYDAMKGEARKDPLTGLCNRRELFEKFDEDIARAKRKGKRVSFLMLDIDHFKQINDSFGHAFGDNVLQVFSRITSSIVRPYDTVARYGGEEFALILPDTNRDKALQIADRIRLSVKSKEFHIQGKQVRVTLSGGLSVYPDDSLEKEDIMGLADQALYHSKEWGRDMITPVNELLKRKNSFPS